MVPTDPSSALGGHEVTSMDTGTFAALHPDIERDGDTVRVASLGASTPASRGMKLVLEGVPSRSAALEDGALRVVRGRA